MPLRCPNKFINTCREHCALPLPCGEREKMRRDAIRAEYQLAACRRHALVGELLHAHAGRCDVDIALGFGRDVMARTDYSGGLDLTGPCERRECYAVESIIL